MSRYILLASLLAVAILASAPAVQAVETTTAVPEAAAPAAADGIAPATQPNAAAQEPTAEAPAAQPSQSPDDVAGGNEYTEDGVPLGTGEGSQPVEPPAEPPPSSPSQGTDESSAGNTVSVQDSANEAAADATEATLPRTGGETSMLALIGLGLLALGVALGRMAGAPAEG